MFFTEIKTILYLLQTTTQIQFTPDAFKIRRPNRFPALCRSSAYTLSLPQKRNVEHAVRIAYTKPQLSSSTSTKQKLNIRRYTDPHTPHTQPQPSTSTAKTTPAVAKPCALCIAPLQRGVVQGPIIKKIADDTVGGGRIGLTCGGVVVPASSVAARHRVVLFLSACVVCVWEKLKRKIPLSLSSPFVTPATERKG